MDIVTVHDHNLSIPSVLPVTLRKVSTVHRAGVTDHDTQIWWELIKKLIGSSHRNGSLPPEAPASLLPHYKKEDRLLHLTI
jgi:hypothetical protein